MELALIGIVAAALLVAERRFPGRILPRSPGWHARAVYLNVTQLAIVVLGGVTWSVWLQGPSLFEIGALPAALQGFVSWFVGTFVFYWWHRARHASDLLWRVLHQIHHSAARIETLTSFYKHPLEIALNSVLSSAIIFVLLGADLEAAAWYSAFAALGEFYYHMNLRTPRWTGYFLQRPVTWWDRLFGTFKDADAFSPACGYEGDREQRLVQMLAFQDVNKQAPR